MANESNVRKEVRPDTFRIEREGRAAVHAAHIISIQTEEAAIMSEDEIAVTTAYILARNDGVPRGRLQAMSELGNR